MSKKPLFIRLAQPTYGAWLLKNHHIQVIGMKYVSELKPPFLVMANHAHTFDPFLISAASPVHIRWVAGAYLFKMRGLRTMMERWIGAISKQQGRSDLYTIRTISDSLKKGEVVGVFPEGTRSWDGEPVGFDIAIAKMIKIFKVPIVLINLEGFYGLKPRWADKARKGKAILHVLPPVYPEEFAHLPTEQIYQLLQKKLEYSYRDWQNTNHLHYQSPFAAEGVEQVLYLCPDCHHVHTISSKGKRIICSNCKLTMELDDFDKLHTIKGNTNFEDVAAWHSWQKQYSLSEEGKKLVYPPERGVLFQTADERHLILISKTFTLGFEQGGMRLKEANGKEHYFAYADISSMVINAKNTLEFYHNQTLYRVRLHKRGCILKYLEAYKNHKVIEKGESV